MEWVRKHLEATFTKVLRTAEKELLQNCSRTQRCSFTVVAVLIVGLLGCHPWLEPSKLVWAQKGRLLVVLTRKQ